VPPAVYTAGNGRNPASSHGTGVSLPLKTARILILFAHPAFQKSRVNRVLIGAVQGVNGVTFHDLYQIYPDFDIDAKHEQNLLGAHDILVFQYPFLWYSVPALVREWQDLVLENGWAYGPRGTALRGKRMLCAVTTGGGEEAYSPSHRNRFTMRELLAPMEQMARLCGMGYLPPFVVHGTFQMTDSEILRHALDYRRTLEALRDGRVDLSAAGDLPRINLQLDTVIRN
jgi:glutathione-regulated potassium-efflux system ancillary protein KefG